MEDALVPAGQGIVTKIGWEKTDEGEEVFRAVVKFPNGPPDLPFNIVWDRLPVTIEPVK